MDKRVGGGCFSGLDLSTVSRELLGTCVWLLPPCLPSPGDNCVRVQLAVGREVVGLDVPGGTTKKEG